VSDVTTTEPVQEEPEEKARPSLDLRNTWQVAAGAVLVPAGVVVILLAWYGAAHTQHVQQQVPYMVSGSFLGLGMMVLGGFFFWAHWLYRIYDQADLHHEVALRRQEELFGMLAEALLGGRGPTANGSGAEHEGAVYRVTATGTNFHLPGCPVLARRRDNVRALRADEVGDLEPCRICQPLATTTGGER
jgi:hypothetical protein